MTDYYGKYDKKQAVQLFVDNLLWGNVSINSFVFQMDGGVDLRRSLEQNMIDFKKNPTEQTVDRIYEAIIRLRVNGALSYELRNRSAEEVINSLSELIKQKDNQIDTLHAANLKMAAELSDIQTKARPMSRDFQAHS